MREQEVAFYKGLVERHRGTPGQVAAGSHYSQVQRFEVMEEIWDAMLGERARRLSLLDFGCGKGDLADFLARREGYDVARRYIGVDGIEENIEDARALGPYDFRCLRWDGRGAIIPEEVDLIVFSGALATATFEDKMRLLARMLELARVGVIGNFVTYNRRVEGMEEEDWHMLPETVLAAIDRSVFRVRLRADYKAHDFTFAAVRWDLDC